MAQNITGKDNNDYEVKTTEENNKPVADLNDIEPYKGGGVSGSEFPLIRTFIINFLIGIPVWFIFGTPFWAVPVAALAGTVVSFVASKIFSVGNKKIEKSNSTDSSKDANNDNLKTEKECQVSNKKEVSQILNLKNQEKNQSI